MLTEFKGSEQTEEDNDRQNYANKRVCVCVCVCVFQIQQSEHGVGRKGVKQLTNPSLSFILRVVSLWRHQTCTARQSQWRSRRRRLRRCSGVTALLDRQSATPVHAVPRCRRAVQDRRRREILRISRRNVKTILTEDVAVWMATRCNRRPCYTSIKLNQQTPEPEPSIIPTCNINANCLWAKGLMSHKNRSQQGHTSQPTNDSKTSL